MTFLLVLHWPFSCCLFVYHLFLCCYFLLFSLYFYLCRYIFVNWSWEIEFCSFFLWIWLEWQLKTWTLKVSWKTAYQIDFHKHFSNALSTSNTVLFPSPIFGLKETLTWPFHLSWAEHVEPGLNVNLTSTAVLWSSRLPIYYCAWTISDVAEPLTNTWPQRDEETRWRGCQLSYRNGTLLHLFPCALLKNLEAITAPSYLISGEIWSELTL